MTPPDRERRAREEEVRRDPRNGKVAEGTWPVQCEHRAFVNGAKWWEWQESGSTLSASEIDKAEAEANRLYGAPVDIEAVRQTERDRMARVVETVRQSECWPLGGLSSHGFDAALDAVLAALAAPPEGTR